MKLQIVDSKIKSNRKLTIHYTVFDIGEVIANWLAWEFRRNLQSKIDKIQHIKSCSWNVYNTMENNLLSDRFQIKWKMNCCKFAWSRTKSTKWVILFMYFPICSFSKFIKKCVFWSIYWIMLFTKLKSIRVNCAMHLFNDADQLRISLQIQLTETTWSFNELIH